MEQSKNLLSPGRNIVALLRATVFSYLRYIIVRFIRNDIVNGPQNRLGDSSGAFVMLENVTVSSHRSRTLASAVRARRLKVR